MKIIVISLSILLLPLPLLLVAIYNLQEKLIFFPQKLSPEYQFIFGGKYEEINFQTEKGISINSLLFHADSSRGLILYFHGNAGCLSTWGEAARDFLSFNYDVLLIDFRGYGKSTGKIHREENLHTDADFIYKEMQKKYKEENIVVYGRSLGSGIAVKLASSYAPKLLVLETPFYSMADVAKHHYPILPISLILKYKFENHTWLKQAKCPVFLIHGTQDEVVPYNSSSRLAAINSNIKLFTIEGGAHNNLSDFPEFHSALKSVLY